MSKYQQENPEFRKVPDAGLKIYVKLGDLGAKLEDHQIPETVRLLRTVEARK